MVLATMFMITTTMLMKLIVSNEMLNIEGEEHDDDVDVDKADAGTGTGFGFLGWLAKFRTHLACLREFEHL